MPNGCDSSVTLAGAEVLHTLATEVWKYLMSRSVDKDTLGPFIREKIRRKLDHLYEHVLFKTKTARINGSRLISVLDSFSCECCP